MEMLQSKEKEIESPSSTNSPLLVEDTLFEILLSIPADCLIGFKCVCKSWFNMIADRAFIEAHLHHWKSQPGIITNMMIQSSEPRSIYRHLSFNFDDKDVDVHG
ncbi:hypothetical protein L1049_011603 [Liquidambar formosana]|uniref:F-box domain-containing protein n=1 Tax=Liquidambar formosana TaxID=63359 RepID=A0AAP0WZX8_LIQFO